MEYMNWRGNPQGYCTICGKRIISRAKKQPIYCSKCAKKVNIEKTIERKNKRKTEKV